MGRLAPSSDGAAVVHDRLLVTYDLTGTRVGEHKLDGRGEAIARFGEEWLVLAEKQKQLARVANDVGEPSVPFAVGKQKIGAFGVGRDDAVAVARGATLELWSRDDRRRWSAPGGPFSQTAVARDHVVALDEEGALVFFSREKGEPLGALRLASTDPCSEWHLAHIDGDVIVLALGEWLVWIDAKARKTVRRVRAKAKVRGIAADGDHVAVVVEDGFVQAFRATTGEPRAAFAAEDDLTALALAPGALFSLTTEHEVRACDRQTLDVTAKTASPVSAIAVRGNLTAVADRTGRVRILEGAALSEIGAVNAGELVSGLSLAKDDAVTATTGRVVMRFARPWTAPRPVALKTPPTAFAADDAYVFTGTQAGAVDVWDLTSGRQLTTYSLSPDDRITALTRLPSSPLLVVGTGALDGRVLFVDVADAKVVHRVSPHEEAFAVTCLATDARGRIVASGSDDCSVVLLDPGKGRVLARLRMKETPVSMAFEPAGRRLACVFGDGTAAIVTFAQKGATVSDLGLRNATHVAWADNLVFGFKDGHVESGERHARPSDRPAARQ